MLSRFLSQYLRAYHLTIKNTATMLKQPITEVEILLNERAFNLMNALFKSFLFIGIYQPPVAFKINNARNHGKNGRAPDKHRYYNRIHRISKTA